MRTLGMDMSACVPVRQILDGLAKAPPSHGKGREQFTALMDSLAGKLDIACRYRQWWMPFEVLVIELFVNSLLRRRIPASIKLIG